MTAQAVFVDTSPLLLAVGAGPLGESWRWVLVEWRERQVEVHVGAETIQEYAHHRLRRVRPALVVEEARSLLQACVVHPLDETALGRGLDLVEAGSARGRDAMLAGTALAAGFTEIVSADSDFDRIPGLRRVDPTVT